MKPPKKNQQLKHLKTKKKVKFNLLQKENQPPKKQEKPTAKSTPKKSKKAAKKGAKKETKAKGNIFAALAEN